MTVERNRRKTKVGVVVSDKMDKTVVVAIEDWRQSKNYGNKTSVQGQEMETCEHH